MTLESDVRSWEPQPTQGSARAWEQLAERENPPAPQYAPSTWVKLFEPPTAFSFDEAWLLCQCADNKWLAWIPDYGEILLNENEFCHEFCTVS
ncbi:MAG: hypothetical protein MUE44_07880 [Oscillatoriaceae cyanobacterium Prado104]|nr:hypothetical protein [Oscillatoriaceae cyanobacterium Prado104]